MHTMKRTICVQGDKVSNKNFFMVPNRIFDMNLTLCKKFAAAV